ncbi:MAG: hypothetical protein ACI9GC_000539, partial [Phycisphaerales bacterium]
MAVWIFVLQSETKCAMILSMAAEIIYTCESCGFNVSVWDDGNPYYLDPSKSDRPRSKQKVYVYHPSDDLQLAVVNDVPHICLSCLHRFKM